MNTWNEIHANWIYVIPPSRPSKLELDRIRVIAGGINKSCPVAVLGSTAEYRDLLYELGFKNIFVFEKNIEYYKLTNTWRAFPCACENIVLGDWCETIGRYEDYFSLILSDLTMGNVRYSNRKQLYKDIANSLINEGVFADKVLTHSTELISLDELGKRYTCMPINLVTANQFSCEALFCSELLKNEIVDTTSFYSILREKFANNNHLLKIIEMAHLITPENCVWYYGKKWDELKDDYFEMYDSFEIFEDDSTSPYYKRQYHFINRKGCK